MKTAQVSKTKVLLAFSAEVYPKEPSLEAVTRLDKEYEDEKQGADVKVYDTLPIRQFDKWTTEKKNLVFFVELELISRTLLDLDDLDITSLASSDDGSDDCYSNSDATSIRWSVSTKAVSPIAHVNIECPIPPNGGENDYDVTSSHMVFLAQDPHLPLAWHTRVHVYLVPLYPRNEAEKPRCLTSQGGIRNNPVFSPTARLLPNDDCGVIATSGKIAWLEKREDPSYGDRNRIMIFDMNKDCKCGITEKWDRSPVSVRWGKDDKTLYAVAEVWCIFIAH